MYFRSTFESKYTVQPILQFLKDMATKNEKQEKEWAVFSVKCCKPFKQTGHLKVGKKNLWNVSNWMCSLIYGLEDGVKICDNCRIKLSKEFNKPDS